MWERGEGKEHQRRRVQFRVPRDLPHLGPEEVKFHASQAGRSLTALPKGPPVCPSVRAHPRPAASSTCPCTWKPGLRHAENSSDDVSSSSRLPERGRNAAWPLSRLPGAFAAPVCLHPAVTGTVGVNAPLALLSSPRFPPWLQCRRQLLL